MGKLTNFWSIILEYWLYFHVNDEIYIADYAWNFFTIVQGSTLYIEARNLGLHLFS